MRILLVSHVFAPLVGGIPVMSELLAEEFIRAGHDVVVVTPTPPGPAEPERSFRLVRQPGPRLLLKLHRDAEVVFHNNITLTGAWPLLVVRRPWVLAVRTWIARNDGSLGWQDRLKRAALRFASVIAISRAVAASLPKSAARVAVVPNSYRDNVFFVDRPLSERHGVVFVGRLVSDKGVDQLIRAAAPALRNGQIPRLTIVGEGSDRHLLETLVLDLGLHEHVRFEGVLAGEQLRATLAAHRVLAVPSRWDEPFGIVALEGVACGCIAVVTSGGGLPEAAGPCGIAVPNNDEIALADALVKAATDEEFAAQVEAARPQHLLDHRRENMAAAYLAVIEAAARGRRRGRG